MTIIFARHTRKLLRYMQFSGFGVSVFGCLLQKLLENRCSLKIVCYENKSSAFYQILAEVWWRGFLAFSTSSCARAAVCLVTMFSCFVAKSIHFSGCFLRDCNAENENDPKLSNTCLQNALNKKNLLSLKESFQISLLGLITLTFLWNA